MIARVTNPATQHTTSLSATATAEGITLRGAFMTGCTVEVVILPPELDGLRQMAAQVAQLRRHREPELTSILLIDMQD